jgi:hypothetical protein
MISGELIADDINFGRHNPIAAEGEIRHRNLRFYPVPRAIDTALPITGKEEDSLLKRLARNGAAVHTDPANHLSLVDDRGLEPDLGGLNRGALTRGTATKDQQIVIERM